jgi:hypothetical protein
MNLPCPLGASLSMLPDRSSIHFFGEHRGRKGLSLFRVVQWERQPLSLERLIAAGQRFGELIRCDRIRPKLRYTVNRQSRGNHSSLTDLAPDRQLPIQRFDSLLHAEKSQPATAAVRDSSQYCHSARSIQNSFKMGDANCARASGFLSGSVRRSCWLMTCARNFGSPGGIRDFILLRATPRNAICWLTPS